MSRLPDIVTALERAQLLVGTPDLHTWPAITGLTADSRKVAPGILYCAVRGSVEDGHRFVAAARERGAVAALVEREQPVELPQVLVRDGRRAAATAAAAWYGTPAAKLDLVGVTGTNGKTTSVTLARHVLSALEPTGSIGTLGAFDPAGLSVPSEAGNLTTPGPIDLQATLAALVERGARGAAMEVSSHSLDQGRVDGLVFRAAIFTNLTRDHLDYHKTVDDYFQAKAKLIGYLAPDGLEVVNADDPAWQRLRRAHRRVAFGERGGEVTARRVALDAAGARFELVTPTGSAPVQLPLLGRFNVANALGVAACAWGMGVPVETIAERLAHAPQVPGRMERIAERPCVVLRDYAHTPACSVRAATATAANARPWGRCARASPTSRSPRPTIPAPRTPRRSSTTWKPGCRASPITAKWTAARRSRSRSSWRGRATRSCSRGRATKRTRWWERKSSRSTSGWW